MKRIILPFLLLAVFSSCKDDQKTQASTTDPMVKNTASTTSDKPMPSEFADPKYMDMGKQMMKQFEDGKIEDWANGFADNAVYLWSAGDSLAGKKAIMDYWKNRRDNVIETIHFTNDIWLPLKVNQSQRGPDIPGIWLLNWYQVNVKYKNSKALQFWVHTDYHYDAANKVDRCIQYIDRAPINAAIGMK
ncbi:MAG: nuclear transport factor 2 family protein [Bacteroidota bacterium]|nr:nuclear transport factor 2 family protein [Bacteroidota bacterium]